MKLKDLNIGFQLQLGLGAIILFVIILSAVAWIHTDALWRQTKELYEHPFTVGRALGDFKVNILSMHREMKNLPLCEHEGEIAQSLQQIDADKANAFKQLETLSRLYLGPRQDIDQVLAEFVKWNAIREETIRLLRAGNVAVAAARTKTQGLGGAQAELLMEHIYTVDTFSRTRANNLYRKMVARKDSLNYQLVFLVLVIILVILSISFWLVNRIRSPLQELVFVTEAFQRENRQARSTNLSPNEFGVLAQSFNRLADAVQAEMAVSAKAAQIAGVMLIEEEAQRFCHELLKALLEQTNSQLGAVYLLSEDKTRFEHFVSIGMNEAGRSSFSATEHDGEFGAALATGKIQHLADISANTRFMFSVVSGQIQPREIVTIPIRSSRRKIMAMISLASLQGYDATAKRLLQDVRATLTARLEGVLATRKLKEMSLAMKRRNMELEAQKNEITAQSNELHQQNMELQIQKKQLDEANRLKSAFLSNMSHELRTPLNSVIALSSVLSRRLTDSIPQEEHSYLTVIERNGKHLLSLINDILDLSRIEAGREEVSLEQFSVSELATQVVEMLELQAQEKGIALLNRVSRDLPPIISDFSKCRHILQNIVGNAVKFTDEGRVEITAEQSTDSLSIIVTDTGIGIAEDRLRYIFDEFRQADETTSKRYGGAGLGLSIARKYAMMLGGEITVRSSPGQGTVFVVVLPLAAESRDVDRRPAYHTLTGARKESPTTDNQAKRILIVEDSEPVIIQMKDFLSEQGYQVQTASNGKEALEQIQALPPHAVILDLMMPEVDGFEMLRRLRSQEETAQLPVLILTAKHVTKEELRFLKGNHIHQLVQKGVIHKSQLLAAVAEMVSPPPDLPAPTPATPRVAAKPLILVVEDNPDNLLTVKALIADQYRIIEAGDGKAGVEQAQRHQPDLILMDIALPVMNGVEALAALRKEPTTCRIPVIALTASAMKEDQKQILAHGFDGYISKPIDEPLFRQIIQEALDDKQQHWSPTSPPHCSNSHFESNGFR